jgi:hypothetical protein
METRVRTMRNLLIVFLAVWIGAHTLKMVRALAAGHDYAFSRWDGGALLEGKVLSGNALLAVFVWHVITVSVMLAFVLHWLPAALDQPVLWGTVAIMVVLEFALSHAPEDERGA